jgi:predicted nuclease of restriction endonuclease-like (RecB) superfamily
MLEKDIENLLARYPDEFFPNQNLTLKGQQVKLGTNYADLVFENPKGELVIIEIKKGLLKREALGQVIEYYGLLREIESDRNIELILVANVIPKEMAVFPRERLGVEFIEIPHSRINKIAQKYGYHFLDSEKPELLQKYNAAIQKMNIEVDSGIRRVWIFQANPQRYDVLGALADETLDEDMWLVSRYKNEICAGDIGLIWMSGKEGGIYSVVDVLSNPQMMYDSEQSTKYWESESDKRQMMLRIKYRHRLKLINNPITRQELKNIPQLRNMEIFRRPIGTNFRVTNDEWEIILGLIKKRFDYMP